MWLSWMTFVAVLAVLAAVAGIAAIRTGWTLPWLRSSIVRPRLWGYGLLLYSFSVAVQLTLDAFFAGTDAESMSRLPLQILAGLGPLAFTVAAQRPGRARDAAGTGAKEPGTDPARHEGSAQHEGPGSENRAPHDER